VKAPDVGQTAPTTTPVVGRRGAAGPKEFVVLVACCMGMAALSIDLMLPAFPQMRRAFGLEPESTRVSFLITAFLLGLAIGQLVYGPMSDRFGRKPMLYAGLGIYATSAAAAALMPSLTGVIICRVLWGMGAAAPRSLALAMVRDTFHGDQMARAMSHVMATFIVVPVFAPGVGALLLAVAPWRVVFWLPVVIAAGLALWTIRLPETLPPERRRAVNPAALGVALGEVVRNRRTAAFALALTCLFGTMASYIGSAQILIVEVFGQADAFPLIFGVLACMLGVGNLVNGAVVQRFGFDRLVRFSVLHLLGAAAILAALAAGTDGRPPLWAFCGAVALLLPAVSMLMPNANTAAMAPLPHVAGMAAAVLGTVSTGGGALIGSLVDSAYDGSIKPFAYGALALAMVAATSVLVLAGPAPERAPTTVQP